ncbi:hypothetical protein J3E68DRAFT_361908 [Trichoderma sp. SZMC 28012]
MPGHHLVCHGIILVLSLCRRQNSLCMQRHRLSNRERLIADPSSPFGFLTGPLPVPLWRRLTILPVHKGSIPVNVQSNTRLVRARDGAVPAAYMLVHAHIASKSTWHNFTGSSPRASVHNGRFGRDLCPIQSPFSFAPSRGLDGRIPASICFRALSAIVFDVCAAKGEAVSAEQLHAEATVTIMPTERGDNAGYS